MSNDLTKNRPFDLRIEWSKWLLTLGIAICAALWKPVKDNPGFNSPLLYAWCSFALAVVISSWIVHSAPEIVESTESKQRDRIKQLKVLLTVQYCLFLIGVALAAGFVLYRAGNP